MSYRSASSAQDQSEVPLFYGDPSAASHRAQGRPSFTAERSYHSRSPIQDESEESLFYGDPSATSHRGQGQRGKQEDIVIAVMGMTGSGKSKFIGTLTGDQSIEGHSLQSCTQYPTMTLPWLMICRHAKRRNVQNHLQ
jgi:transcriptional regulator of acetoin/glycerol metabolism